MWNRAQHEGQTLYAIDIVGDGMPYNPNGYSDEIVRIEREDTTRTSATPLALRATEQMPIILIINLGGKHGSSFCGILRRASARTAAL
jgi:hypothetical protein